jgi:hypothetical protein
MGFRVLYLFHKVIRRTRLLSSLTGKNCGAKKATIYKVELVSDTDRHH